jgi:hypothetical protein
MMGCLQQSLQAQGNRNMSEQLMTAEEILPTAARNAWLFRLLVMGVMFVSTSALAEWQKTITCPAGYGYRDLRIDAGRDEFCLLQLPGDLWVRDGESRFWYSEGHSGEEGSYKLGRKIGRWKECSRFDQCQTRTYELQYPLEQQRGVQPNIPVSYSQNRYVFDFRSCWGTWVTRQTNGSFIELNIGADLLRCNVTYIPSTRPDRPSGTGGYFCQIPFEVGVRAFESVDLRSELPRVGLPQFCHKDQGKDFQSAMVIAFWSKAKFPTSDQFEWVPTANMVDVECAAMASSKLTLRLNAYAEKLVLAHMNGDGFKVEACGGKYTLSPTTTSVDSQNRTLFNVKLSNNPTVAARQRACITAYAVLQPSCTAN